VTNWWCVALLALTLSLTINSAAQAHKRATPPTVNELIGAWIALDSGGGEFTRAELYGGCSGYIAVVAPSNFITHDYGVQVYRVSRWSLNGWHISCELSPISSNAEPAQANGEVFVSSLRLNIHRVKRRWKIESALYMESRVDDSNTEAKDAVAALQRK
jgi:hypothetical protein